MKPITNLKGHPDMTFASPLPSRPDDEPAPTVAEKPHPPQASAVTAERHDSTAATLPPLTHEIALLAASLAVPEAVTGETYDPDRFVQAIREAHAALSRVKTKLTEQAAHQRAQAHVLAQREEAVIHREAKVKAIMDLLTLEGGKARPWWRFW